MRERVGEYMQTRTGTWFYPLDPSLEEIHIEDIAHALANVCRFGGHTSKFYSVAQHSVLVSHWCPPEFALWGLLHDAAEAYIGDMTSPLKYGSELGRLFGEAELRLLHTIVLRFKLGNWPMPPEVKQADDWILCAEGRDFMGTPDWVLPIRAAVRPPLDPVPTIEPWSPKQARYEFLLRFYTLRERQQ